MDKKEVKKIADKEVKVHEDYFQLLPNYSYFALSQTGGFQHQFSVITENGDYDLGLNEVQDFANKKATKFYRILAGAPGIPQKPFDYPAELSALADEIKKQDDVKAIKYLGRYALVRVQQWIPAEFSEFSKKFYIKEVPNSPIKCIFSLFDSISKPLAKN
jgi:hypothetical protein